MLRVSILHPIEFGPKDVTLPTTDRAFAQGETVYERTAYDVSPGYRDEFVHNLKEIYMPEFARLGARVVGIWDTPLGERNQVVTLLAFPDIAKRAEFTQQLRQADAKFHHVENSINIAILHATRFLPKV